MNANEIVRLLRSYSQSLVGYKMGCEFAYAVEEAASLIESLQAQLAECDALAAEYGIDGKTMLALAKSQIKTAKSNVELQAQLAASQRRAQDARNELCIKCGKYREAHNGACDGCRWKE